MRRPTPAPSRVARLPEALRVPGARLLSGALASALLSGASVGGCSAASEPEAPTAIDPTPSGAATGATPTPDAAVIVVPDSDGVADASEVLLEMPAGFTATEVGGYRLGEPLASLTEANPENGKCGNVIRGVVRDFKKDHPDFEDFCCGLLPGIVASDLGAGRKPVYAAGASNSWLTSTADNFAQWYASIPEVNQAYVVELYLAPGAGGVFTFESQEFFPLDNAGWGNEDLWRNFHFTTEIHTRFHYAGGEIFTFNGDDDLWVFINGKLALDLGGVHDASAQTVTLDASAPALGLVPGQEYDLDLFHAERHTGASHFRIDTTLDLVDCGIIVPDIIQ